MRVEYWIERFEDRTNIERQPSVSVAQHYVLWPHQMISAYFADGVGLIHADTVTIVKDPNVGTPVLLEIGDTRRIIIQSFRTPLKGNKL